MAVFNLQAAIDALVAARGIGGVVDVPRGQFLISTTIDVQQVRGLIIRGQGAIATDLRWVGPPNLPMFRFGRTQGCYLEHVSISARKTAPLLEGVRIEQGPSDRKRPMRTLNSSLMTVRDVVFSGQGALGTAIRVYLAKNGPDAKNDHHRFERLSIRGCTYAGMVLEGRNAKALHLDQVVMAGGRTAADTGAGSNAVCQYGVLTVANMSPMSMNSNGSPGPIGDPEVNGGEPLYDHGASFTAIGGQMAGNKVANVYIGDRNDELVLQGIYSEKSGRWLVVPRYGQGAAGAFPVKMVGCRYSANKNTPRDREIIQFLADGPLEIDTCRFGQRNPGEQLRIRYVPNIAPGSFSMRNSSISNDGDGNVFVAEPPSNADYQVINRGYRNNQHARLGIAKI
jgi:hypothetical protein